MTIRKLIYTVALAVLLLSLLALPALAKDDFRENEAPYKLAVGGLYVTDSNKADILGDGTAVFDSDTYTLTLRNYRHDKLFYIPVSTQPELNALFSVLYLGEKDLTVIVEGECHFAGALRVDHGTLKVQDARVTFADHVNAFFECEYGLLSIENSQITISSVPNLTPLSADRKGNVCAIRAASVRIDDSEIVCEIQTPDFVHYYAFMWAYNDIDVEDSRIVMASPYPIFDWGLMVENGHLNVVDTDLAVTGQKVAIASLSKAFIAADSKIRIEGCINAIAAYAIYLQECDVRLLTFSDAIALQGDSAETVSLIEDSRLKLERLSWQELRKQYGAAFWEAVGEEGTQVVQSYVRFAYGITVSDCVLNLQESRIKVKGYNVGMYMQGDAFLKLHDGVRLTVKKADAAFVAIALTDSSPIVESSRYRTLGKALQCVKLSNNLTGRGQYLFTFARGDVSVGDLAADASLPDVLSASDGSARTLRLYSEGAVPGWAIVLMLFGGAIFALVLLAVLLMFVLPKKKETEAQTAGTDPKNDRETE